MNIRNKPCQCGSNKKYKICCFNPNDLAARIIKRREEFRIKQEKEEKDRQERAAQLQKSSNEFVYKNSNPRRQISSIFLISAMIGMDLRTKFLR